MSIMAGNMNSRPVIFKNEKCLFVPNSPDFSLGKKIIFLFIFVLILT